MIKRDAIAPLSVPIVLSGTRDRDDNVLNEKFVIIFNNMRFICFHYYQTTFTITLLLLSHLPVRDFCGFTSDHASTTTADDRTETNGLYTTVHEPFCNTLMSVVRVVVAKRRRPASTLVGLRRSPAPPCDVAVSV